MPCSSAIKVSVQRHKWIRCCQSVSFRDSRDTPKLITIPTCRCATAAIKRPNPARAPGVAPLLPWSSSMMTTCASLQPSMRACSAKPYCRRWLSRLRRTCSRDDCRTYTNAARAVCSSRILDCSKLCLLMVFSCSGDLGALPAIRVVRSVLSDARKQAGVLLNHRASCALWQPRPDRDEPLSAQIERYLLRHVDLLTEPACHCRRTGFNRQTAAAALRAARATREWPRR